MTFREVALDVPVKVIGFKALSDAERLRLAAFGLREGSSIVKIVRTPLRDPVECLVDTQLVTLDRRIIDSILVKRDHDRA